MRLSSACTYDLLSRLMLVMCRKRRVQTAPPTSEKPLRRLQGGSVVTETLHKIDYCQISSFDEVSNNQDV